LQKTAIGKGGINEERETFVRQMIPAHIDGEKPRARDG